MAPWWDPKNSVIDSHVFKDDDGKTVPLRRLHAR